MYSLLNAITHSSDAIGTGSVKSSGVAFGTASVIGEAGNISLGGLGKGAEQRRMTGISTIGMVTRLALELDDSDVSLNFGQGLL